MCAPCLLLEYELVLRLTGLIIVLVYTCVGAILVTGSVGATRILGLGLVLTGLAWLVIDVLRRRVVD